MKEVGNVQFLQFEINWAFLLITYPWPATFLQKEGFSPGRTLIRAELQRPKAACGASIGKGKW